MAALRIDDFIVDINKVKRFTITHLQTSLEECPDTKKKLYDVDILQARMGNVEYLDRVLINISDIAVQSRHGEDSFVNMQIARQSGNPQQSNINTDILEGGWDLSEYPIAVRVRYLNNGKAVIEILEGRTRLITLRSKNVENIIADRYLIEDDADAIRAAQIFNTQKKEHGQVKPADIRHSMRLLLEMDAIDLDGVVIDKKMTNEDRQKTSKILMAEVERISIGKLKNQDKDRMVTDLIEETSGVEWSRGFATPSDVLKLLDSWGCKNTNDIEYYPATPESAAMVFSSVITILTKADYSPQRQYRIVNYVSALKADALEKSWEDRTFTIKAAYDKKEKELLQNFFGYSNFKVPSNIQLFGAIPQVKSLHKDCWNEVIPYQVTQWEKANGIHRR